MDIKSQLKTIIQEEVRRQLHTRLLTEDVKGDIINALQGLEFSPSEYADFQDNLLFVEEELTDGLGIDINDASVSIGENSRLSVGFAIQVMTDQDVTDHFESMDEDLGIVSAATDRTGYLFVVNRKGASPGIKFNQFKTMIKSFAGNLTLRESYRDQEMVINQPNYGSTPYGQAVAGRAIDSWDKLIAVLNSYDIHAEMSDDRRHLQQRRDVNAQVKDFLKTYSGPKSWSKLTDTGREALGIVGIR